MLLYKLCYYTTPFEDQGPLAILNAKYTIPPYPAFSHDIQRLIISMLKEDAHQRPNIYQVVKSVSKMRGLDCPIRNVSFMVLGYLEFHTDRDLVLKFKIHDGPTGRHGLEWCCYNFLISSALWFCRPFSSYPPFTLIQNRYIQTYQYLSPRSRRNYHPSFSRRQCHHHSSYPILSPCVVVAPLETRKEKVVIRLFRKTAFPNLTPSTPSIHPGPQMRPQFSMVILLLIYSR